jgi:3-methyladenine DNA glycosylase Tag
MPNLKVTAPKNDDEYFERMTQAVFQAGLNWKMIEDKWSNFEKAFAGFSIPKIARFGDKQILNLMTNQGIVRNERKIRSTIYNAQQSLAIEKEFGSFKNYFQSFGKDHAKLMVDIQSRFKHLGESSSRTFLWMAGVKLEPTSEEKQWLAKNHD